MAKKPIYSARANMLWCLRMLIKTSPLAFFLMAIMVPMNIALQYLTIYLPALVVSEVSLGEPLQEILVPVGGVILAMLVADTLVKALEFIKQSNLGIYRYKLGDTITRKNLGLFYQTYEKKEVRELARRAQMTTEMWGGVQPTTDIVTNGFGIIENIIGYFLFGTVISFASPWLLPFLTIVPIFNLLAVRAFNRWEYRHRSEMTELNHKLGFVEELPDNFAAAKDIRIYSMASWLRECYRDLSAKRGEWDKKTVKKQFLSRLVDLIVILVRDGAAYAILISMVLKGEIGVDQFVLYFAAISSFATWVGGIIDCWNKIHENSLKICDYREYADFPDEDGNGGLQAKDYVNEAPEIVFDHVSFRYEGAEEDTIHDISFTLHRGEKLALVGLNGAGKTTIVKLLCGLYRPSAGEIRLNGMPIGGFARSEYYKLLSPVFQDVRTAFFSLAETVSAQSLTDTDVKRAEDCLRTAGLGDKIDALPEGIYTKLDKTVNKDGTGLSGGEAQRLMLARALYKDAPVLVLDEPTAALDPIAESRIYTEYNRMTKKKTSLFISHRLASTSFCDRILVLEKGRIAEEGSHEGLMRQGGIYKDLFDIQSAWYQEEGGQHEVKGAFSDFA